MKDYLKMPLANHQKTEKGIKKRIGNKRQLMCTNSNGVGFCIFIRVLTLEEQTKLKNERSKKASSKF